MDPHGTGTNTRTLGLTGPIACGKTTVGDMLLQLGALERIDADRVVHQLMAAGTSVTAEIRRAFGTDVLRPDGSVDRARLGAIVFSDPQALQTLESITHPAVRHAIRERLRALAGKQGVVVIDAVKLLQSDLLPLVDAVWVVECAPEVERQRLVTNRKMTAEEAAGRLAAQPSFEHPRVTTVISNSGSLEELRRVVRGEWRRLLKSWGMVSLAHF